MLVFELGQFVGALVPCTLLRLLAGWVARAWPPSVPRLVFLNLFSFLVASWLMAHGTALSEGGKSLVSLSTLHVYLLPQCLVLLIDLLVHYKRGFKGAQNPEKEAIARKEPTF